MATTAIKSKANKNLTCSVLTREGPIIRNFKMESIKIPSVEGEVMIYKNHSAYMTSLDFGLLTIVDLNKNILRLYVDGGIVEVLDNEVSILSENAIQIKNIKPEEIASKIKSIEEASVINEEEKKRNDKNIIKLKKMLELYNLEKNENVK